MNGLLAAAGLTLAASAHCAGMCGGFAAAATLPAAPGALAGRLPVRRVAPGALIARQLQLQAGKGTTYLFLGALAGAAGGTLLRSPVLGWGARALAILAGLAILGAGLTLLGVGAGGHGDALSRRLAPLWSRVMGPLLETRPSGFPIVLGIVMGFFPCPLVYAGLGAAAATGSPIEGALVMAGVALGTVPALALAAAFGSALSSVGRRHLARVAGVLLIAAGLVTAARGIGETGAHGAHHLHAAPRATSGP